MMIVRAALVVIALALPRLAVAQDAGAAAPPTPTAEPTAPTPTAADPTAAQPSAPPSGDPPQPVAIMPRVPPAEPAATCTLPPKDDREARAKFRLACATAIEDDADWQADITTRFERQAHERSAQAIRTNQRHVLWAYGFIWVALAGLVGVMWVRQQRLNAEIARLNTQLQAVEAEDARRAKGKDA